MLMVAQPVLGSKKLARCVGWSMLAMVVIGIASSLLIANGIDINQTADVKATAENMLEAEQRLRAKAYVKALLFGFETVVAIGLFMLLRASGQLLASLCLFVSVAAATLSLLGAVFSLNAAEIAGDLAYANLASDDQRLLLASVQATSEYTSFHLGLIMSMLAKAGFYFLFVKSNLIPTIISGWGLFASLFVSLTIIARDFIPALGHGGITVSFMAANLIAMLATSLYLIARGVRLG